MLFFQYNKIAIYTKSSHTFLYLHCQQNLYRINCKDIKETWTAKIKEIERKIEELMTFCLFFARFRVVEKASEFCGHVCRLDLDLGHDVSYMG